MSSISFDKGQESLSFPVADIQNRKNWKSAKNNDLLNHTHCIAIAICLLLNTCIR